MRRMSEFVPRWDVEGRHRQLRTYLAEADQRVWSSPDFPEQLRPDITQISENYQIGRPAEWIGDLPIHPAIPSPLRNRMLEVKDSYDQYFFKNKISFFDPDTGRTVFHPLLFNTPTLLKRTIYHEAITAKFGSTQRKTPDRYSRQEEQLVSDALAGLSVSDHVPLRTTVIDQMGFRKLLMADGYALADLVPPEVVDLNEMLPVAFEIITDQVMRFTGSLEVFSARLRSRALHLDSEEDHPQFAATFFRFSRHSDWRWILGAFTTTEYDDVVSNFDELFGERGSMYLSQLVEAMVVDETHITDSNAQAPPIL